MSVCLRRREFIAGIGGAAASPLAARAQQPRRIGVLMDGVATDPIRQARLKAFTEQLRKLGWIDGENLRTESRWDGGDPALTRTYAAELATLAPDVILSAGTQNLTALQRLSPVTPIVFVEVSDPVVQGIVMSMAHSGTSLRPEARAASSLRFGVCGRSTDANGLLAAFNLLCPCRKADR
jgi:putative ABC transport system substrate-binding protein